ncbi:MAG: UDP-3-O-(3-hydroxymyristoyl)glucosamine N-acyltransferase [Cytophagales bacterium]|nr:UDP-3-O-(3-hydroxymyristoyl)glucosamine N-acyltransferase [Cytophagales bacterium]
MKFTVDQIADLIEGTVNGNGATLISNFDKIEEGKSGSISFLSNPKYESFLYQTDASAVIISKDLALKKPVKTALILVSDPYLAFTILLQKYQELVENKETGIQVPSYVADSAHISENVFVGRFTLVDAGSQIGKNSQIYDRVSIGKNVTIGCDCTIYPGVVIYKDCVIGNNVVIHANSVIGSDGFGHAPQADGTFKSIPQLGNVVIEDDVSIGSNTTIDRATMGSTIIRKGVKIDNLVQIAHNVEIGSNTAIAAQTGISGSTKVGENCLIAGQVGVAGHITIAPKTIVTGQSGVTKSVKTPGQTLGGTPASNNVDFLKRNALIRQLPEFFEKFNQSNK